MCSQPTDAFYRIQAKSSVCGSSVEALDRSPFQPLVSVVSETSAQKARLKIVPSFRSLKVNENCRFVPHEGSSMNEFFPRSLAR